MAIIGRRLACFAFAFAAIWTIAASAVSFGFCAVLMNPVTYEQLADDRDFAAAIQEKLDEEMVETSQITHLPQELLTGALPEGEELHDILRSNLADFPLILGGSRQDYSRSFDAAALREDILVYAESTFGDQFAEAHAEDLGLLSEDIARAFEGVLRVIDANSIVAMPAFSGILAFARHAWLFCVGAAALSAACIAIVCRLSRGERDVWLFSIGFCAGVVLLIPAMLVEALGLHALGIEPAAVALLIDHGIRRLELVFAVTGTLVLTAAAILLARYLIRVRPTRR